MRVAVVALSGALFIALLPGCASLKGVGRWSEPAVATYPGDTVAVRRYRYDEAWAKRRILKRIRGYELRTLGVLPADGTGEPRLVAGEGRIDRRAFAEIPPEALLALESFSCRANVGAEFDILVPSGSRRLPLTVWCRSLRDVDIAWGPLVDGVNLHPDRDDTVEERTARLRETYGIGPLEARDRAWNHHSLGSLEAALQAVPEAERAALVGLPFVRERDSEDETGTNHAAYFRMGRDGSRIIVLNRAFEFDGIQFVGTPAAPSRLSTWAIVHEIGHALARASLRLLLDEAGELIVELEGAFDEQEAAWDAMEEARAELAERRRGGASGDTLRALEAAVADAEETYAALEASFLARDAQVQEKKREAYALRRSKSVVERLMEVEGADKGPTRYGRSNPDEAFAEAYAMFHLDPAALLRVAPAVHAWFAAGEHTRGLPPAGSAEGGPDGVGE